MKKRLIISTSLFILTIAGKLIFDLHLYFNEQPNNHLLGPAIVLISLGACSWLAGWKSIPMWFFGFWALFDSLYGLFIHHGLLYIGTTAWLDILQHKYSFLQVLKYILATGSIVFYFLTNKKQNV